MRCVRSLKALGESVREIIVVDDFSDAPLEESLRKELGDELDVPLVVIRHEKNYGYIVARNTIARRATQDFILSLDDDALLLDGEGIRQALAIMSRDEQIGAVAFAQANADGELWPQATQPSPTSYTCYVAAFIGFAVLLRRATFLSLGGYRGSFHYYGEEKEYCLRLLDAGGRVIYLPEAKVGHIPDPSGRNVQKYLRYCIRNDCLGALYNQPLPLMTGYIMTRLYAYLKMKRHMRVHDPGGLRWIIKELVSCLPEVRRERRPLSWATFRRWKNIRTLWPPYPSVEGEQS